MLVYLYAVVYLCDRLMGRYCFAGNTFDRICSYLFVPLHRLFKLIGMRKRGDVLWERTELGNEAAGKIAALRRFIHDFSMLSTAEKEEALLWEDYLVYAIVLEDNKKIVKDISKQFNIELSQFDRLRSFNIQR